MTVDTAGRLYVATDDNAYSIRIYSPTANGTDAPIRYIYFGSQKTPLGLAADAAGNIFVAVSDDPQLKVPYTGQLQMYSPTANGAVAPTKIIASGAFNGVSVDTAGKVYALLSPAMNVTTATSSIASVVTDAPSILTYTPQANGSYAVTNTITLPSRDFLFDLKVDKVGNLYTMYAPATSRAFVYLGYPPSATGVSTAPLMAPIAYPYIRGTYAIQ